MSTSLKCMFKVYGILQLTCNGYITTFDEKFNTPIHWMYMVTHVDTLLPSTASRTKTCSRQLPFNESAHFLRAREYTFCWKPCHTRSSSRQGWLLSNWWARSSGRVLGGFTATLTDYTLIVHLPPSYNVLVWKKNPNKIMFFILPLKDITYSPNKTASAFVLQYLHTLWIILSNSHAFPCFDPVLTV